MSDDSIGFLKCDRHHIVKSVSSPDYIDSLLDIFQKEKIDLYIPLIEDEFLQIHENFKKFKDANVKILIQPKFIIERFLDKFTTSECLNDIGVNTPETLLLKVEDREKILDMAERHGYPLFAKPRRGRSSKGLLLVKSESYLDFYLDILENEDYVIQEYLGSDDGEYTCTLFKTPSMEAAYDIIFKRKLFNGTTVSAEVTFDEEISKVCQTIGKRLPVEGSLNVQMRKKNGVPHVFEINPRYSSTVYIRALCGFNDVEMGISHILNEKVNFSPDIKKYRVLRYWEEYCIGLN